MKGSVYSIIFSVVLSSVCAAALTAAAVFTGPRIETNRKAERVKNILSVMDVPFPEDASGGELLEIFNEYIVTRRQAGMDLYVRYSSGSQTESVAVPFSGSGLWGPIKGFICLEGDLKTVRDITFYQQEETPGLGGEIASKEFTSRFRGVSVLNSRGEPGLKIDGTGAVNAQNEVDAVSGATMSCEKVEDMLNNVLEHVLSEVKI